MTQNSEHTTGPWNLHPHMDTDAEPKRTNGPHCEPFLYLSRTIAKGDMCIGQVTGFDETDGKGFPTIPTSQVDANARRIIAAVNACEGIPVEALESDIVRELLAACILGLRVLDVEGEFRSSEEYTALCNQTEQTLRAAIAKAKGEIAQ